MYQVHNVMNENVLTVSRDATVDEAIRCLIENHMSGMPVVDGDGRLVGFISEFQLLETLYAPEIRELPIRDVMTRDVLTVTPSTMLSNAIGLMVVHRIRRLPVVDGDRIVGVVSRHDLLRYTQEAGDKLAEYLDEIKGLACASAEA